MRALLLLVPLLCGCSTRQSLTVGSKNFTEQIILGEIVAQHLERRLGQPVSRKLDLGGTLLAHQALVKGEIDLYPEYTGTALTAILKLPPSADAAAVLDRVRSEYRRRWHLEWLAPLGFNNSFAMVIRGRQFQTLSDAAHYQAGWRLGVGYEFLTRPDGLPGLLKTYNLKLNGSPKTMDLGLLYKALEQNQVNMVAANSTDGMLSAPGVNVLEDDKRYFPPYEAAIVMRENSRVRAALEDLSGKFTDVTMRQLNYEVDGRHRPVREVAAAFLATF